VWAYNSLGAHVDTWPVEYPTGMIVWDFTDGFDAVDDTHYVRTGWLNTPQGCDAEGAGCLQSAIEILERKQRADNTTYLEVVQQIHLPELPDLPLNREFGVGVTSLGGGRYAVSTLPGNGQTRLIIIDENRNLLATPVMVDGSREGLFVDGDGRLGALDYSGALSMHDAADATPRAGETATYTVAAGFSVPAHIMWDDENQRFIAYSALGRLAYASATFDAILGDVALDLSGLAQLSGMTYLGASHDLAVMDRLPPLLGGVRTPAVQLFNLDTLAAGPTFVLNGGPALPLRPRTVAFVPSIGYVVHHRRPGGVVDAALDATAYVHDGAGNFVRAIDLAPIGVARITSVNYLHVTDELAFFVVDTAGIGRLVITSVAGAPRRSYPLSAIAGASDLTQLPGGELGVIFNQPSEFARVLMP
jgi:hypothetical protein